MHAQYDKQKLNANEQQDLQKGMACTKQSWLLTRYLNDQLNSSKVIKQYIENGLAASAGKADSFMNHVGEL